MKRKSLIVFITHILAFLCVCTILGCSVESSSGEEKPVVATYTVSYLTDKGISSGASSLLNPITVADGTVISEAQLPKLSEKGWNFEGWYDGETKVVAGTYKVTKNVLFIAKWKKIEQGQNEPDQPAVTYTVSYSSDKGVTDASLLNPITLSEGTAITSEQLPELSANGWSFEGWYDGETKVIAGYKVTKNITLVAKWSKTGQTEEPSNPSEDEPDQPPVTYTVSYSTDKGVTDESLLNPITLSEGTAITSEQLPELSANGWSFEGWYDGETKVIAGYKVTKNITLVAKWTLNPKYTVEHWLQNLNDDEYVCKQVDSQQLYGKAGTMTTAAAKNYPGFKAQEIEQALIQPDGSTLVKIKYDRKIVTVIVNLEGGNIKGNANNITAKGKFEAETKLNVKDPEKTDCEFGGWSMDIPKKFPADDVEIKALWGNIYSVAYQTEKDTDSTPATFRNLEDTVLSVEQLPELSETGWIFEGWYDGGIKVVADEYRLTKNVTLVAKWSPATVAYTVEHCQQNIDDDKYNFLVITESLSGKTEELTAAVAKEYPGFTAQNITQSRISADGSTVVKVYYDRKIISLTFKLDGGNIDGNTEDVIVSGKYGANVSVLEPVKADCKFIGWDKEIPQTFNTENDVFVAQWKGTASITINLFDWDSDLKIIKETERIYNVVVPESYTDISYYINNQKQSETSNNYKFRIPEKVGCYNLFIKAKKNGLWYSYSLNAVVSISED